MYLSQLVYVKGKSVSSGAEVITGDVNDLVTNKIQIEIKTLLNGSTNFHDIIFSNVILL